jgi:putative ABC transport system substrate-binding protein
MFEAFQQGLRELGYVEGQNLAIEPRGAEGRYERLPDLAAELVRLQPDVLVSSATPATRAAQQATSTIPIVFIAVGDPVGLGIVASLDRPGGNVTGVSDLFVGLSGKRLELLKETVPGVSRVAALWNPSNPAIALEWSGTQEAGRMLGLEVQSVEAHSADDLAGAFETIARERADALIVLSDPLISLGNAQILDFAVRSRLPTMHSQRATVEAGGLMSYGPSLTGLSRRGAYYVDRILKGTKPANLPVEQPREFELVVNRRTAQALGLTIPADVWLQTTEVIE